MIFETVRSEALAHFSYVVGDEDAGVCAVIDPRRDVEVYLDIARQANVRITGILETHIHADYVSGSLELAARTGAPIYLSAAGEYGFEHVPVRGGDELAFGAYTLRVIETPGHTPEHVCFLISGGQSAAGPWGLFTGDTLFAGEVGRPDLLGKEQEVGLARQLYDTLFETVLPLGDEIIIYPAHGEGSPCGANIGARMRSTIGYERLHSKNLQAQSREAFVEAVLAEQTPAPRYYPRMKQVNAAGPRVLGRLPDVPLLDADRFEREMQQGGALVLDARDKLAFGGAHVEGAWNIGLDGSFPLWVGWFVEDPETRLLLVLPGADDLHAAVTELLSVGYENIGGALLSGMDGWNEAGKPFRGAPQMSVHALRKHVENGSNLQILDVRREATFAEGHVEGAVNIWLPELPENLDRLDRDRPVAAYCTTGYRSSIAASILQNSGFPDVRTVPGSMVAWQAAGYPVTTCD